MGRIQMTWTASNVGVDMKSDRCSASRHASNQSAGSDTMSAGASPVSNGSSSVVCRNRTCRETECGPKLRVEEIQSALDAAWVSSSTKKTADSQTNRYDSKVCKVKAMSAPAAP